VDRLLGEPPRDWGSELLEQSEKMQAALDEQSAKGRKVVLGTTPAHPLADYADRYEHPAYGTLEVRAEADRLAIGLGTIRFQVSHRHYETYDLSWTDLSDQRFTASFVTDESGSVSEVRPGSVNKVSDAGTRVAVQAVGIRTAARWAWEGP